MAEGGIAALPRGLAGNRTPLWLLVGGALLASALLLWLATGDIVLSAGAAAGMLGLGGFALLFRPGADGAPRHDLLPPDWSVTHAAADFAEFGLAITDRAGRLVCANTLYARWMDGPRAPANLDLDGKGSAAIAAAMRAAWRDGSANIPAIARGQAEYRLSLRRAGAGDDYLVWQFAPLLRRSLAHEAGELVSGDLGRLLSRSGLLAVTLGPEGRIRAVNSAFALRAAGREGANLTGRDFTAFLRTDERGAIFFEADGRRAVPLRLVHLPIEVDQPDGPALILLRDEDGATQDRAAALAHVENLLSNLPLGLALLDRDGRFLFANDSFSKLAGLADGSLPLYPGDLVIREDKGALADAVRRHAGGQPTSGDLAVRPRDRPDEVLSLTLSGVRGLGEAAVMLSLKDSGEETKLKRQIAQQTKMQAVGQLAGGVAHDFNNILTAIIGHCDLMLLRLTPGDSHYDDIQQIKNNSNRAASLTRQLLAFSRQQTLRPQVLQLPDLISDVSNLLRRLLGETVKLDVHHGRGLGAVRADPGQLEQVIVNLGVNARDAIMDANVGGGVVTIETAAIAPKDVRALDSDVLPEGDYICLSVTDSGTGIPKEAMGKIFEPFFTTKEMGKGTGLGLSTVYGIVKQSGGYIFARNPQEGGARFEIYLPVHKDAGGRRAETPVQKTAAVSENLWGTGTILLVEDEDMVRTVAQRALARQGYTVDTAADGEEALELVAQGRAYDLVVSDVVMPNMDGPAMARQLRKSHPALPILFMSGYAEEQLRESIDLDNVAFLPKPFSVQQIAEAVGKVLRTVGKPG